MDLRYPAVPLVTHTPYFNIWSMDNVPNRKPTCHWTGRPHPLTGSLRIGGREYGFLGETEFPLMEMGSLEVTPTSTTYVMTCPEAQLAFRFTSPLLLDDYDLLSRPVTYLSVTVTGRHGREVRDAAVTVTADSALCLDRPGDSPVEYRPVSGSNFTAGALSNVEQKVLNRSGDDVRIDWGTLYLAAGQGGSVLCENDCLKAEISVSDGREALFALAYDEVKCIQYFGKDLDPLWKRYHNSVPEMLDKAFAQYGAIKERCFVFSAALLQEAEERGGEQYAQILAAAYRQTIAAHGICADENGDILFVSKECYSNGCAATADVSYPSIPLYLLYNPELVFGMMRPVMRYAASPAWPFDFAPHDAGQYPLLNGQVYSDGTDPKNQMPVEECGNMLLMTAAATLASGDDSFAEKHWELLTTWANYLRQNGLDPDNQLCTDDFAGHLAHNCNLSIKAIMGVAGYGILLKRQGKEQEGKEWLETARSMGRQWAELAQNGDGTYRLAFDRPDTFSLKYNAVWDALFGTEVFPKGFWTQELRSYLDRRNPYGTPLDNRAGYTKSDWLVWAASMMDDKEDFVEMIGPLWLAYHEMPTRVPLTDWYETENAWQHIYHRGDDGFPYGFQNRTVQGGLFMKLLMDRAL